MPLELLEDNERFVVVDTDSPLVDAVAVFEGANALERAEGYLEYLEFQAGADVPALTWPERYAIDAGLRVFVQTEIQREIIGFDTAMYNAAHFEQLAQLQADKVFALEKQIKALERQLESGLQYKAPTGKKPKQSKLL